MASSSRTPTSRQPTLLSTFTGLGGLDLGLEAAGFQTLGVIERDSAAVRSLKANRGDRWPVLSPGDVDTQARVLSPKDLGVQRGELTLLAGAPPCQPFSKAGQWTKSGIQGLADPRAQHLNSFLDLLDNFRPKMALLENVEGFVKGSKSALPFIEDRISEINSRRKTGHYLVDCKVLDAAEFGVPQRRRRAIIIISRTRRAFRWPQALHAARPFTAWDAIGELKPSLNMPSPSGKWATLLPTIPEGQNYQWHTRAGGGSPLFGYRTRYWSFLLKLAKDQPSWTIPANPGPSVGPFHWDNRPLSVEELLALQTFPTGWLVEGSRVEQVKQVGNATPPLLGEVLGGAICETLGLPHSTSDTYLPRRALETPPPSPVSPLPPRFAELVGEHKDHPGIGLGPGAQERRESE